MTVEEAKARLEACPSCFKTSDVEPVQVRHDRETGWVDSTLRRCANPECHAIREGTTEDRLTHLRNVYDYKYFGDYELSPEQLGAVWEAFTFAMKVPALEARAESLARLQAMADTGTAENFLSCDDETKRLFFAHAVEDSSRRKAAEARATAAEARVKELEEGLRPFAEAATHEEKCIDPDYGFARVRPLKDIRRVVVSLGELRRARSLLQAKGEGNAPHG